MTGTPDVCGRIDLEGTSSIIDFPIKPVVTQGPRATVSQLFDVIYEYKGPIDINIVKEKTKENKYNELMLPVCPKCIECLIAYTMNLSITELGPNRYSIIKQFIFLDTNPSHEAETCTSDAAVGPRFRFRAAEESRHLEY